MNQERISGLFAAVLIPRDAKGELVEASLSRHLDFLVDHGVSNFVLNGATGEYCLTSALELKRCLDIAKGILPLGAKVLCGIGAAGLNGTLKMGTLCIEGGAHGLLLPMPYFFQYAQDDLAAFIRVVASELCSPILLYNLPQFTTGIEVSTIVELLGECSNIVGIKDSSGSLDICRHLSHSGISTSCICGSDEVLSQALTEGICSGAVSGVAGVMPELLLEMFNSAPESTRFRQAAEQLREFVTRIDSLPCPWGLKAIAEARGISKATYNQPLSPRRAKQIGELQSWCEDWLCSTSRCNG